MGAARRDDDKPGRHGFHPKKFGIEAPFGGAFSISATTFS
jgi:hypothetical protein